jgi:predicted transcriptional regulator of viral defense system
MRTAILAVVREAMSSGAARRRETTSLSVARVAGSQWGVVNRHQLLECGLSPSAILRWRSAGRLHALYPGVYAVGHAYVGDRGRLAAALLHAGRGAVLSHTTAASWWGLTAGTDAPIHISVPRRRRLDARVVAHHPRALERTVRQRLPVTPVARTLRDLATVVPAPDLRKALAEADYRQLADIDELRAAPSGGAPGSAALRAALARHLPELALTASPLEDEFLFLCESAGFPLPGVNRWVGGYKVDALWREQRLIVELDGRSAHGSESRTLIDRERDVRLRSLGFEVRRYTWHQVTQNARAVVTDLRPVLGPSR